jgi:hypothetical protein
MKIAFIGGGLLATSVAVLAKARGHESVFGVRDPLKLGSSDFPRTGIYRGDHRGRYRCYCHTLSGDSGSVAAVG